MDKKFNLTITPSEGQFNISNLKWTDQFGNNFSQGLDFLKQSAVEKNLSNEAVVTYAENLNDFLNFIHEKQLPEVHQSSPDIDEIPQLVEKVIPYLNGMNTLITKFLLQGGRCTDVLLLTIGDWRTRQSYLFDTDANSKKHKCRFLFSWDEIEEQLINYCNNGRRKNDVQGRDLEKLVDNDPIFINKWGNPIDFNIFQWEWKMACQKAKVIIPLHLLRHYAKQKKYLYPEG